MPLPADASSINQCPISFRDALHVWLRIAAMSFGGPSGQIAVMHRILVEEKKWLSEERFLHALNFCMLLPGPEAQQLVTYSGWLMFRFRGGLIAGSLFVLPGFLSILFLSWLYVSWQELLIVQGIFLGMKGAILAIVIEALLRISRRALKNGVMWILAALSFIAIFSFKVNFPWIILSAALIGWFGESMAPKLFQVFKGHGGGETASLPGLLDSMLDQEWYRPRLQRTAIMVLSGAAIWLAPLAILTPWLGWDHVLVRQELFFSRAAVVTFGGAYAVLPYVAQQAVEHYNWLTAGEMLDGLGMAETTPGPLIQIVQFVAFLGAYRSPSPFSPFGAAFLASCLTTWATYVPCFIYIFAFAPYLELVRGNQRLKGALSAITAAVVGVILNLTLWFGMRVLFDRVTEFHVGPLIIAVPEANTIQPTMWVLAAGACVALFRYKRGMLEVLAACASAGLMLRLALGH